MSWSEQKGFAILLGWFFFCVRKSDDVIPDYVIVVLRFFKNGPIGGIAREKGMNLDRPTKNACVGFLDDFAVV